MTLYVTRLTAVGPLDVLGKGFGADGEKYPPVPPAAGCLAERLDAVDLEGLRNIVQTLPAGQSAMCWGVFEKDHVRVFPQDHAQHQKPVGIWAVGSMVADQMAWPDGHGVMMLDHDGGLPLDELLFNLELAGVDCDLLIGPSASAYVGGQRKGWRILAIAEKASDIPELGRRLMDRIWLTGGGGYKVTRAGTLMESCLLDATVWQPVRCDFLARPWGDGAAGEIYNLPVWQVRSGARRFIEIEAASPADKSAIAIAKIKAKAGFSGEAEKVRAEWAARMKERHGDWWVERYNKARSGWVLPPDMVITVKGVGETFVSELQEHKGKRCRDPFEPEYGDGSWCAQISADGATLHSYAHGGYTYRIRPSAQPAGESVDSRRESDSQVEDLRRFREVMHFKLGDYARLWGLA